MFMVSHYFYDKYHKGREMENEDFWKNKKFVEMWVKGENDGDS